jgi:hypothetical protein
MSERAFEDVNRAQSDQIFKALVRTILTKVEGARRAPEDAGSRWPFELLQNATDAGPRPGRGGVSVEVGWDGDPERPTVTFVHDGAPFRASDLAALLYGSSNKDFDSEDTTGRFGTGFLVTHVLATTVHISGLIAPDDGVGCERFRLTVDRGGDEARIRDNTRDCAQQLREAEPVGDALDRFSSAEFRYQAENAQALRLGVDAFVETLPFLFSTCAKLAQARVRRIDGTWETWSAAPARRLDLNGAVAWERDVRVESERHPARALRSIRVAKGEELAAAEELAPAAVLAVEVRDGADHILRLGTHFPRVFRRFPVRGMALPVEAVIDGPFDVDQERRVIHLTDKARAQVAAAFDAVAEAAGLAVSRGFSDAHVLARVRPPPADMASEKDLAWWRDQLRRLATLLARLPLVRATNEHLPVLSKDRTANFPLCRLLRKEGAREVPVDAARDLMARTTHYLPPALEITEEWTQIAEGWSALGVEGVNLIAIEAIAHHVKAEAKSWDQLKDVPEPRTWLLDLFEVVGKAWRTRNGVHLAVLQGLIPDQNDVLRSPKDLRRDQGIPEELKDIAESLGIQVRTLLLHLDVSKAAVAREQLSESVQLITQSEMTATDLIEQCIDHLTKKVPAGRVTNEMLPLLSGAAQLARYLWTCHDNREAAVQWIRRMPFLTAMSHVGFFSPTKRAMAPVALWAQEAQPFAAAYPEGRVLHASYGDADLIDILAACELVWKDPLIRYPASELTGQRLRAMARLEESAEGVVISGEEFAHVALLTPEVINHVTDRETAKALLGLILQYIAKRDDGWQTWRRLPGRKGGARVEIEVRDALWVGDLVGQAWVHCEDEQGKPMKARCTPESVERGSNILDHSWLSGNDAAVQLLSQCFGFDALDLRLISAAPNDPARRSSIRDGLARIVDATGGDLQALEAAASSIEDRKRHGGEVQTMRDFGLAVQKAVERTLLAAGLKLQVIDRGFDFAVFVRDLTPIEDLAIAKFEVGSHLVEVKATRRDEVSMTPLQAQTAGLEQHRYSLCVVDLAGVDLANTTSEQLGLLVEQRARFVIDIGADAGGTAGLIEQAKGRPVSIRNDSELRYTVPASRWRQGLRLASWVEALRGADTP